MQDFITLIRTKYTKTQLITFTLLFVSIIILIIILVCLTTSSDSPTTSIVDDPGAASDLAISEGDKERENYPIVSLLPITNSIYKLGYSYDESGNFYVSVKPSADFYLDSAIKKLVSLPISILDYTVKIRDFSSFFTVTPAKSTASDPATFLRELYPSVMFSITNLTPSSSDSSYTLVTLTTGSDDTYSLVTYHCILHRAGNTWELTSQVSPILTKSSVKSVPEAVLREIKY